MLLDRLSITGADDAVDVDQLNEITNDYPFIEWAILWHPEHAGQSRYPTREWILNFVDKCEAEWTALHLCAQGLIDFINGDPEALKLVSWFDRIQLNLVFEDAMDQCNLERLVERVKQFPEYEFIFQYNERTNRKIQMFEGVSNLSILFDESAGCGARPERWPSPIDGFDCGYAGGLNVSNIEIELNHIVHDVINDVDQPLFGKDVKFWADLETGAREHNAHVDKFSLSKVRALANYASPYVAQERDCYSDPDFDWD